MEPLKRPSDNEALVPPDAPESKLPRPSDPTDGPPSPTLLKALEAVLIAGRRGLLGPAAMEVAAGSPPVNLGASNGMVGQRNLKPIPLVEGQEKKKKPVNQKRTAVITIVPHAKGVESTQVTPKDIWICGNSVILSSKKKANSQPFGLQLGISTSKAHVYWHGINSMKWEQLVPLLHEMYLHRSSPSVIIVHLGEDDLLPKNNISLMISMKNDLGILKRAFPDAIIVWSSLLPRCACKKGQNPQQMEAAQKLVNKKMVDYCNQIGVHFLSHNLITSEKANLFLPDINALSSAGIDIFIEDLKKVLRFYGVLG